MEAASQAARSTPLFRTQRDNRSIYRILKEKGVSPTLTQAIIAGDIAEVKALINNGADVNIVESSGRTPLRVAITYHDEKAASVLLDAGADPSKPSFNRLYVIPRSEAPISLLADECLNMARNDNRRGDSKRRAECDKHLYRLLRAHGASPTLVQAIALDDSGEANKMIAHNADMNVGDDGHGSALAVAVEMNNRPMVMQLLAAGADAKRGDARNMSAIQVASTKHDKAMLQLLRH